MIISQSGEGIFHCGSLQHQCKLLIYYLLLPFKYSSSSCLWNGFYVPQYGLWVGHVMGMGAKLGTAPWLEWEGCGWRQKRSWQRQNDQSAACWRPRWGRALARRRGNSRVQAWCCTWPQGCLSLETWPWWAEVYTESKCREDEEEGKKKRYAIPGNYWNRGGFNLTNVFWVSLPWSHAWVVSNLVTEQRGTRQSVFQGGP